MLKESTLYRKINNVNNYDAVENLLSVLRLLSIGSAKETFFYLVRKLRNDYYCSECDQLHEDCFGHNDLDYPDWAADDWIVTTEEPSEKEKV